ncbi:hypothetical protein [Peribacillus sp. JNUCC41]|uniref:hypothetical protein n=1 Tax=Peribacillus sp. JNUCC41 TaxID=2778370 RepID=UPI001783D0B3|nr:hypothetical protein [Brevibacillus sp. JNUCC-41]QOS88845.1 hypothetical protein JNUCC41_18855 [Brevibacillus sp. JNUCC-41]
MLFLKANDLKKSYGNREVLSVDSLHLYSHDRVDLVGRNGEGKTTLLSYKLPKTSKPNLIQLGKP